LKNNHFRNGGLFYEEDEEVDFHSVSHLISKYQWNFILKKANQNNPNCKFLTPNWVYDSSNKGIRISESNYEIKKID
jgi:hypothetical protein